MSIASRIQAIEQHLTDDYNVLEVAGADLTNVNKNILNLKTTWQERLLYFMNNGTYVVWNNWDKVTGEGTNLTLNNTEEAPMKINLKGNTSQATTTGKNLLKNTNVNSGDNNYWNNYSTYDEETRTLTRSTTSTTENYIGHRINLKNDTKYTISCLAKSNGYVSSLDIYAYNSTTNKVYSRANISLTTGFQKYSFTFTTDSSTNFTNSTIRFDNNGSTQSGTEATLTIKDVMLVEGEDTGFEPYTGNIPAPNPDYPQDIHVVSGDNEIVVSNANKLPYYKQETYTSNGITHTSNGYGTYSFSNGTTTGISYWDMVLDETYTIQEGDYIQLNNNVAQRGVQFVLRDTTNAQIGAFSCDTNVDRIYSLNNYVGRTIGRVRTYIANNTTISNLTIKPMICNSSSQVDFVIHQSQTYPIDLPSGMELCKIGNYQDYFYKDSDKWYLHKEIGKVVLNGSETFDGSDGTRWNYTPTLLPKLGSATSPNAMSNYYTSKFSVDNNSIYVSGVFQYISIMENRFSNVSDFKTWLSTHNTIVYYALNTPTYTEITDSTLLSQLNALARSYTSQTNISQESNDLPFIINATALKEME